MPFVIKTNSDLKSLNNIPLFNIGLKSDSYILQVLQFKISVNVVEIGIFLQFSFTAYSFGIILSPTSNTPIIKLFHSASTAVRSFS